MQTAHGPTRRTARPIEPPRACADADAEPGGAGRAGITSGALADAARFEIPGAFASELKDGHLSVPAPADRLTGATFASVEAFRSAARRVAQSRGATTPGVDGVIFDHLNGGEVEQLVVRLVTEINDGTYEPGRVRRICRKEGTKARDLGILTASDRVVQQALRAALEPALSRDLAPNTYACAGRGPRSAVEDVLLALDHAGEEACIVKADIANYFDSIDVVALQRTLFRRVNDRRIRRLTRAFLRRGQRTSGRGLVQGAPLSPLLANWYLSPVDWFFERRRTVFFARYMDDVLIVVPGDVARAQENLAELGAKLDRLGLSLNHGKTHIVRMQEGVEFLGFHVRRSAQGVRITASERSVAKLKDRLDEVPDHEVTWTQLGAVTAAWAAYFDLAPQAVYIANRLVHDRMAARLLRQSARRHPIGNQTIGDSA